jgi:hypothetical protein
MAWLCGGLLLTDIWPLAVAWRSGRDTALRHALLWTMAAWAGWVACAAWGVPGGGAGDVGTYAALCLTGCAGVAVLGARRPGVAAWNFVVAGLLAVLLRPVWEGLGELHLREAHLVFLIATLAVPLLNYLPTRLGLAALALGLACGIETARLAGAALPGGVPEAGHLLLAVSPWLAWAGVQLGRRGDSEFDRLWLAYRDRFGLVWGQRMREQFNRAAANAGWPVSLAWGGLRASNSPPPPALLIQTLRAVLKRFAPEAPSSEE